MNTTFHTGRQCTRPSSQCDPNRCVQEVGPRSIIDDWQSKPPLQRPHPPICRSLLTKKVINSFLTHSQFDALPKYTSSAVTSAIKSLCKPYLDYAIAYGALDKYKLSILVDKHREVFEQVRLTLPPTSPPFATLTLFTSLRAHEKKKKGSQLGFSDSCQPFVPTTNDTKIDGNFHHSFFGRNRQTRRFGSE